MRRRTESEGETDLPVDLWEYLQPYIAEEPAPALEWAVRRAEQVATDERGRRTHAVPKTALA